MIRSASTWRDRKRRYKIKIDGKEVGTVKQAETVEFGLAPGSHSIRLTIDWKGSAEIKFRLQAGDVAEFRADCGGSPRQALPDLLSKSKHWIELQHVNG